jgi:hypothetical protein
VWRAGNAAERSRSEAGSEQPTYKRLWRPIFCIWLFGGFLRDKWQLLRLVELTLQILVPFAQFNILSITIIP